MAPRQKSCRLPYGRDGDDGRKNLPMLSDDADCGDSVGKSPREKKEETLARRKAKYIGIQKYCQVLRGSGGGCW